MAKDPLYGLDLAFIARMGIETEHLKSENLPPSLKHAYTKVPTLQAQNDAVQELEEQSVRDKMAVREYGYSWMIPLGRHHTLEEDAESTESASARGDDSPQMGVDDPHFANPDGTGANGRDLDADIEDADANSMDDGEDADEGDSNNPNESNQGNTTESRHSA